MIERKLRARRFRRLFALLLCAALLGGCRVPSQPEPTVPTLTPNPYSAEDFDYKDGYLTCISGESLSGVDVSSHQGQIDWELVRGEGFSFAMIRLGYRGWGDGSLNVDTYALENLENAAAAGLQVGGYFFSQATSPEEAVEEAEFVLALLDGRKLDLPLVFDWEIPSDRARTKDVVSRTLTDCTKAFCRRIEAAGYQPMVYFNLYFMERYFYLEELSDYPFWFALYDSPMRCPIRVDMWQYSSTGVVPGIDGNVDLNLLLLYDPA